MEVRIISEQEIKDMILSTLSEEINPVLWCENGSLRMDIKDLQEQVQILKSNVEQLKKIAGWSSGYDDHNWDIEKSLTGRVDDLEEVWKYIKA